MHVSVMSGKEKDPESYRLRLHINSWKNYWIRSHGRHFQALKDRKMIMNKQHLFTKGKSSMAKLTALSDIGLALWMRGEHWLLLTSRTFFTQSPYRKTRVIASGWVKNKVDESAVISSGSEEWSVLQSETGGYLGQLLFRKGWWGW